MNNDTYIRTILDHYLTCALWTTICDTGEYASDNSFEHENYGLDDISQELEDSSLTDIKEFVSSAGKLLDLLDEEQIGYDFWLTRNGHGAGFWDRGLGVGGKLADLCKPYGSVDIYVGDDGQIYAL